MARYGKGKGSNDAKTEAQFELGTERRRVSVRRYNKANLVDIREYYEKEGEWRPGSKGISLTSEQWRLLKSHVKEIDAALGRLGEVPASADVSANASAEASPVKQKTQQSPAKAQQPPSKAQQSPIKTSQSPVKPEPVSDDEVLEPAAKKQKVDLFEGGLPDDYEEDEEESFDSDD